MSDAIEQPDDSRANSPADDAISAWIEDPTRQDVEALAGDDRRRAADHALVDVLLGQALRPDPKAREQRIQRVANSIAADVATPARPNDRRRRRWWPTPFAIAAAVVLAALMLRGPGNPQRKAVAAVTAALQAAESETDRRYVIDTRLTLEDGTLRDSRAELWVRGTDHFVLRQDGPLGELVLGRDGNSHWMAPAVGPVLVGTTPGLLEQLVLGDRVAVPYLQISAVLDRLAHRYDLALVADEDLPADDGGPAVPCVHVRGTRKPQTDEQSPDIIELWAERSTGIARRLDLDWSRPGAAVTNVDVTFELRPQEGPLPANWYAHQSHHAADRRVIEREPRPEN